MGNKELRRDFQHIYCINYWAVWEQFQPQRRGYNQSIERGRVFASKSRQKVRTSRYQLFKKKSRADEDAWGASSSPSKWNRERPYEGMSTIGKTLVANAFKPSQVMQARSSHLSVQHRGYFGFNARVNSLARQRNNKRPTNVCQAATHTTTRQATTQGALESPQLCSHGVLMTS